MRFQWWYSRLLPVIGVIAAFSVYPVPSAAQEKPRTTFCIHDFQITGAQKLGSQGATNALRLKPGAKITDTELDKAIDSLKLYYAQHGFIRVSVSAQKRALALDTAGKCLSIFLEVRVVEGRSYYIAAITFLGNATTKQAKLEKATGLRIWRPYNPGDISQWIAGLNRLGRFAPVSEKDVSIRIDEEAAEAYVTFRLAEKR
ncbi:MAG: POTRA domain-containing protein [Blastocatellia bacterium]